VVDYVLFALFCLGAASDPSETRSLRETRVAQSVNKTFSTVVGLYIFFWLMLIILYVIAFIKTDCSEDTYGDSDCTYSGNPRAVSIPFVIIIIIYVVSVGLRGQYRKQYQFPGTECDDCCCMCCCGFCNVIQMARHTHDEHIYYYHCCNTTGLPPDTPQIV
jgi:Cys-rich protein (TIGR01571 family)